MYIYECMYIKYVMGQLSTKMSLLAVCVCVCVCMCECVCMYYDTHILRPNLSVMCLCVCVCVCVCIIGQLSTTMALLAIAHHNIGVEHEHCLHLQGAAVYYIKQGVAARQSQKHSFHFLCLDTV